MKLLSFPIGLLSLLLSCGVAEAGGIPTDCGSNGRQDCVMYGDPTLGLTIKPVEKQKKVIIPYDDFLVMVSKVEHSEQLKNKAMAENGVLVKLKGEHETIIKIQADQIASCEKIVQQQERLGSTQEQIVQAVDQQLSGITGELTREKSKHKWYAIGGAGVGGLIAIAVMAVIN